MLQWLTDEDFNGRIVRGLFLRRRNLDVVRVYDVGLSGAVDATVLKWAEENQRLLLTHDGRTMPKHLQDHLISGGHVPGVFVVDDWANIGACIDDILLIDDCSLEGEWQDTLTYLPFR